MDSMESLKRCIWRKANVSFSGNWVFSSVKLWNSMKLLMVYALTFKRTPLFGVLPCHSSSPVTLLCKVTFCTLFSLSTRFPSCRRVSFSVPSLKQVFYSLSSLICVRVRFISLQPFKWWIVVFTCTFSNVNHSKTATVLTNYRYDYLFCEAFH